MLKANALMPKRIGRNQRLLVVGAFPSQGENIHGGVVTSCRALMSSTLPDKIDLILVDSTAQSVPPPPAYKRLLYSFPRQLDFARKFHRSKPDAVLVFASPGLSFLEKSAYCAYARLFGIPSILFLRGGATMDSARKSRLTVVMTKQVLRAADRFPCQGEAWREFFTKEMSIDPSCCPVISNWTATPSLLRIGRERLAPGARDDCSTFSVLFIGWLDATKGALDLIRACAVLKARNPLARIRLQLAGEGKDSAGARQLAAELGLTNSIDFHGWIRGEKMAQALRTASVFCLPSYKEGMPNAMIEAMAAALPVVVTPVGNIPDAVHNEQQGLIVPPGDVDLIALALERLLVDPLLRKRMAACAHDTAVALFSAETAAAKIENMVNELTLANG